ncbi:MAG: AAA family ATPase [Planctomycetes bacterium]|nr:AAA family ATPase [Planctomycetota bacterium]
MPTEETSTAVMEGQGDGQYADLFKRLAGAIEEHLEVKGSIDEPAVRRIVDEKVAEARLPRPIEVHLDDGRKVTLEGRVHFQFQALMEFVQEGHRNILMVGPAGSGKTTLAKSMAEALQLPFGFISLSAGVTETHLLGRVLPKADGSWGHVPTRFVEVYEGGGVFLLDEMDGADSNVLVAINAAMANGLLCNPVTGQVHVRHKDCYILAAGNTWGRGGDAQYVGRNQLDAATLDRFILSTLRVTYDRDLERDLARGALSEAQADELLAWVDTLRTRIAEHRLRRVASTRLVVNGVAAMGRGRTLGDVKTRYFQDWSADELAKAEGR